MTDKFDFSLPGRDTRTPRASSKPLILLTMLVLAAVLVNVGLSLSRKGPGPAGPKAALSEDRLKQLALKLEKQGLVTPAVTAWEEYLRAASLTETEIAGIWYRIGKLCQDDNRCEEALSAYYRSESFAKPEDISVEISRRTQECLERMGRFAALRYELADLVAPDSAADAAPPRTDPVVAEIGRRRIRKSELDQRIEHLIHNQLSPLAGYLPEDQFNMKKEELLKQYSDDGPRRELLNQFIMEEVLYRKAREQGLMDQPEIRAQWTDLERGFLAGKVVQTELQNEIRITDTDLKTYYEAHKLDYIQKDEKSQRQKPFDEVRIEVYRALRAAKEQEVQQALISRLQEQYDVVIHESAFSGGKTGEKNQ